MKNGVHEAKLEPIGAALRKHRRRIVTIWICLLLLAGLTVGTAYVPLGPGNMALNILIAGIKVALIGTFFMHLAAPQIVPRMVYIIAGMILVVMFALSGVDYYTRDGKDGQPPKVSHP